MFEVKEEDGWGESDRGDFEISGVRLSGLFDDESCFAPRVGDVTWDSLTVWFGGGETEMTMSDSDWLWERDS